MGLARSPVRNSRVTRIGRVLFPYTIPLLALSYLPVISVDAKAIRLADRASSAFRERILAGARPTLVLSFGDHQPSFSGLENRLPRRTERPMPLAEALQFTNYQFYANYGDAPALERELDIAFLPATVLELAGLPLSPLFLANLRLREICRGRLDLCPAGSFLDSYRKHLIKTGFYQ